MTAPTPAVMGDAEAPPVVEDPAAPSMQAAALAGLAVPTSTEMLVRPEGDGGPDRPEAGAGLVRMPPVPRVDVWEHGPRPPIRLGEQRGTARGQAAAEPGPAYVRLRLRLDRGHLSVVGGRMVEGPLLQPVRLHVGLACEVVVQDQRVAVESIPDLGVWRAFPPPVPAPGARGGSLPGHQVTKLDAFEFQVRVPRCDLPLAALPEVRVVVYRCKGAAPAAPIGPGTLAEQFSRELREVARIEGVRLWELDPEVQEELRAQLA